MTGTTPLSAKDSISGSFGRRLLLSLAGAWTLVLLLSLVWNAQGERHRAEEMALLQARALVDKDLMYRHWNAELGGVWADATKVAPNRYLAGMVDRNELETLDGTRLTLINPAYMSRLVFTIQKNELGITARITSLKPINPDNAADEWEAAALLAAEQGRMESHDTASVVGKPQLRYLRALRVEPRCLDCHRPQGYQVGDIRGGVSVTLPMTPFLSATKQNLYVLAWSHAGVWMLGLLGISYGFRNWRDAESQRRRSVAALDESRAHFRAVVDSALDSIVTMNHEGRVIEFNPMAEATFGYRREEAIDRSLGELIVPPALRHAHEAGFRRFLESGDAHVLNQRLELTAMRRDGSEFPVELTITQAWDSQRRPFFNGYLRDISQRRAAEAALVEAKEAAEAANRAKSEFLANMSHEIRTPMNGVIGMTGLLLGTRLDAEQHEYAETIRDSGESLLALINDILDFSKIEAGKLDLEIIDFDLHALLDDFAAMLALRAEDKGLEFLCAAAPDLPARLRGDPGRLRQILTNLAGNAIKFTAQGEVAVSADLLALDEKAVTVRFSIRDTGIGIPAEKLDLLFQKFTQVGASTTRKFGGTGLGLAISRLLVELMGGEIGVESEMGAGSRFWFSVRLPRQADVGPVVVPASLEGARILVVDDNASNRLLLQALLRTWGAEPEMAANGGTALEKLQAAQACGQPYRIAILDMQMPEMDGAELGRRIRADACYSDLRLAMMTSLGQRGDARRFESIGFDAYLTKPVRQSDLADTLALLLGQTPAAMLTRHALRERHHEAMRATTPSGARILLAEDNVINQRVAVGILKKLGYGIDAVANGLEAIQALRSLPYDLALMDVQMPEMDGLEATRRIRNPASGALNPHIPIIAMTANAMRGDEEDCRAAGMDDYLAKPIAAETLREKLEKWLRA